MAQGSAFPDFITRLPLADLPFPGLTGWILQGETSQLLFLEADAEVTVPEHAHAAQWGMVVAGTLELTVAGVNRTCRAGDSYVIPAGAPHRAVLRPGCRAIDFFADPARYRARG